MRKLHVRLWVGVVLCGVLAAAPAAAGSAELGFEERVAAQWAIEQVYWRHRIWPDANPLPKPEIHEILSEEAVRGKVEDTLLRSEALEEFWGLRLSPQDLQTEIDRMTSSSRTPGVLRELFAALGDDPRLIAECLARPALTERLLRHLYANDAVLHAEIRTAAEQALRGSRRPADLEAIGGQWTETLWVREEPSRSRAVRTESGVRVIPVDHEGWSRFESRRTETLPSAVQEDDDRFFVEAIVERGEGRLRVATVSWWKRPFDEWWTEARAALVSDAPFAAHPQPLGTGTEGAVESSDYGPEASCTPDTWTSLFPANAPSDRTLHSAVWTGAEMIVWGGWNGSAELATGGRYDPATDTWTPTETTGAPSARDSHTAVWTGSQMIVWGGVNITFTKQNTGGRYNPATNTWQSTSTSGAPTGRVYHTAVWTGSRMVIWAGQDSVGDKNTGGRYDPVANTWTSTSTTGAPVARDSHTAVWIANRMVAWGGVDGSFAPLASGGRYDPSANTWTATTTTGAPSARAFHTAVATGGRMIVWGGWDGTADRYTGGIYDPLADNWLATGILGVPDARELHTAVWTGTEMVVWGGKDDLRTGLDTGGRFDPTLNKWLGSTATSGAPAPRQSHTAVWTNAEMLVFGGFGPGGYFGDGRAYCASACSATTPTEVPTLSLAKETGGSRLSWTAVIGATLYDLVRGDLAALRNSSGDFTTATESCRANDVSARNYLDSSNPSPSAAFWYLVRGINCAGAGSYDGPMAGQSGLRDAEIAASANACP